MTNFFPIETPYSSKDYEIMKNVVNMGIDSHLEAFVKSEFKKSPNFNNKFLWNIHDSELPILYRRLEQLYDKNGDEDYSSLLSDIKNAAGTESEVASEIDEMIDPYDPMDANQTIDGEPTATSDLAIGGVDTASPNGSEPSGMPYDQEIENFIDDDTTEQELEMSEADIRNIIRSELQAASSSQDRPVTGPTTETLPNASENSSDSIENKNGENLKPLDETTDSERYESVVFMQGDEANEVMDILNNDGRDAAMEYLKQWHDLGHHMGSNKIGAGTQDKTYEKDGYIMNWNPYLPYIGLVYDTHFGQEESMDEDSQMKRHMNGQREKIGNMPLGQHTPHSQISINIKKK